MPQPNQSTKQPKSRAKHGGKLQNGNGRANGNARATGKARANGAVPSNGRANGAATNGNGTVAADEARRVATEMGNAMLVATSVETARHSDDVELITGAIAEKMGLSEAERDDVLAGARLHDIGKASVPPEILLKPGALDAGEWEIMRAHTIVGEQILASVSELAGIAELVRHSHERWDGGGYPDGLAGAEIPLGSRIIFCADAFHAVRSDRPYRKGRSAQASLAEVKRHAGTQFDPDVVAALDAVVRELRIVGPGRRVRRSSRLTALLLMLAIGGGSSAVARTDLLGSPDPAGSNSASEAVLANPSSLFGPVLLDQLNAILRAGRAQIGVPEGSVPGSGPRRGSVTSGAGPGGYGVAGAGGTLGESGGGYEVGVGSGQGGGAGGGGSGSGSGGSDGNGGGGSGSGGGSSGGGKGNGNGGTAGQSANAPGHGGTCPGNSCNAPGHQPGGPGNSANAPGHNKP